MNKRHPQTITAADLLEVLRGRQKKCSTAALEVRGALTINREDCKDFKSLEIDEMTFTDLVTIEGFLYEPSFIISCRASKFLKGLIIKNNSGARIDFLGGEASSLLFWDKNQFEVVSLCGFTVQHRLELSGLHLRNNLRMEDVSFSHLKLCSFSSSENITVPKVITNNSMVMKDFQLAMIPVFKLFTE